MSERQVSEVYQPPNPHVLEDEPMDAHYEAWGYSIGYEVDENSQPTPENGNTAVFRIFPQGMTEPVLMTKPESDATFTVTVLSGEGKLIRTISNDDVEEVSLSEGGEVTIHPGEAYVYKNTSDTEDLVLHDVALPAFEPGDDMELTASRITKLSDHLTRNGKLKACAVQLAIGGTKTVYLPTKFFDLVGEAAVTA